MLAPRARSALVCLRCEVRTARPRPAAFPRTTTCARFSTSTARRHDANDAETLLETPPAQIRISKEVQPLNKLRKRRGKVIRETSSGLGNRKQLGEAADILVLKEEPEVSNATPEEPVKKPKAIESVKTLDIVASLLDDNRRLTHDEIRERLESLRPKTADNPDQREHVTLTEFLKYTKLLMDSFTSAQLAAYYSATNSKTQQQQLLNDIQKSLEKEKDFTQHTIKRSQWQSGTNPIDLRLPSLIPRYSKAQRKAVHKQLLVNRILRDVWRLVLMEEVESLGQLELYLKPWQVTLLTAGEGGTVLEQIGQTRRARIELLRKESVIRITADKNTTDYTVSDIEKSLSKVESKLLELKSWVPRLVEAQVPQDKKLVTIYSQSDLDAISKTSHTSIEVASMSRLLIRGMNMEAVLEAERYLIKLLPVKDSSVYTTDTTMLDAAKKSAYLLPVYPGEDLIGSDLRNTQLGRWSLPLAPKHEPQLEEKPEALKFSKFAKRPRNLVDHTVAAIRGQNEQKTETRDAIGYWRDAPTSRLYAEIGQIVYPLEQTQADKDIVLAQSHCPRSGFLSKFPGLPNVLTSLDTYGNTRMLPPTLVYDFIPAPQQKRFKEHHTIPRLRIEMHTNWKHGTLARLHKLELRLQSHIHDVHLMDEAADVRFYHSKSLQLRTHTESHKAFWDQDKNVRKWTEAVTANISSGGRLYAPSLSISIPKWTVPGCDSTGKSSRIVDYLFAGVQFRQTILGHYKGMPIQYSTVQSGKFGFTGGQLLAFHDAYQRTSGKLLMDEISLRQFSETCFSLVSRMTAGATHVFPVSKKLKPRHEDSERRLRRAAMQNGALADTDSDGMATADALDEKSSHNEQTSIELPDETGFDLEEGHSLSPTPHNENNTDAISPVYNRTSFEFESPFSEHSSTSKSRKSDSRREEDRQPLKDMA